MRLVRGCGGAAAVGVIDGEAGRRLERDLPVAPGYIPLLKNTSG